MTDTLVTQGSAVLTGLPTVANNSVTQGSAVLSSPVTVNNTFVVSGSAVLKIESDIIPTYTTSLISATAHAQTGLSSAKFVFGGKIGPASSYALFKKSNTYAFNMWRSQLFTVGKAFNIVAIKFNLGNTIDADTYVIPVLVFDNGTKTVNGTVINASNYPNGEKYITLAADNFGFNVHGTKNFYFQFLFSGGSLMSIKLPITIELETEAEV